MVSCNGAHQSWRAKCDKMGGPTNYVSYFQGTWTKTVRNILYLFLWSRELSYKAADEGRDVPGSPGGPVLQLWDRAFFLACQLGRVSSCSSGRSSSLHPWADYHPWPQSRPHVLSCWPGRSPCLTANPVLWLIGGRGRRSMIPNVTALACTSAVQSRAILTISCIEQRSLFHDIIVQPVGRRNCTDPAHKPCNDGGILLPIYSVSVY